MMPSMEQQQSPVRAKDLKSTTIRLQPATRKRLEGRKIPLNSLVDKLLNRWADDPTILDSQTILEPHSRPTTKQLRQEIANSIARHLQENQDWINEVILDSELYREGESVFGDRIDHFLEEKQFLAARFTPWLLKRVLWHLKQDRSVIVVVDSGTSLYWIFRQLGPQLLSLIPKEPLLEKLVLMTNNIPGVDYYMTISRLKPLTLPGSPGKVRLSDYVICKLLTGTVLTKYAAVNGRDTEIELRLQRKHARDAVFIGLLAGNWIHLHSPEPHYPSPLASGRDQVPFKKKLIDICDELYLPVPLGKIFLSSNVEEINRRLSNREGRDEERDPYGDVPVSEDKKHRIKLISTTRPSGQLLYTHSEVVRKIYLGRPGSTYDSFVSSEIQKVPAMLFHFDGLANRSLAEQLEIEFPHGYTRDPDFMKEYFSVSLGE
jgi:hypothetical protein